MISLKSERELELMRAAGRITAEVMTAVSRRIRPGTTTEDLDRAAGELIEELGVVSAFKGYNGYPGIICISVNEEVVHGIGGKRRLREGDLVSLDIGVKYRGYYGDMAATFPVGEAPREQKRLIEVTRRALAAGIEKACPGNRLFDISAAVLAVAEGAGFTVVRDFVGHGIG
ncbi:MAG TPA: type I methionyl aminopeptidase, partial [bacterium]|nr:type I methionyl aminopeptidase [bacterium]